MRKVIKSSVQYETERGALWEMHQVYERSVSDMTTRFNTHVTKKLWPSEAVMTDPNMWVQSQLTACV